MERQMLTRIRFDDIDQTIASANAGRSEVEAVAELSRHFASLPENLDYLEHLDPFSQAYRDGVLEVLALITRRSGYDPERDEAANYLPASTKGYLPSIYQHGDSTWLGEFLQAFGSVLKALDLRRGARVLEYGAGEGLISVQLARMGCDVTVVDIEHRYLEIVKNEAESLHTSVTTLRGQFGDGPDDAKFDAILFFEAFHHALDHLSLLTRLRNRLAPNGRVVFAGEPIMEPGGYWTPTLPYPWGPRLDALSLRAMRTYGWCELGYSRDYFVEALMHAGFAVRFRPCAATARGAAYIAQVHDGAIEVGEPILIEAYGRSGEWHNPEGTHRWTAAEEVVLPLDRTPGWVAISIRLANWLPVAKRVSATAGDASKTVEIEAGGNVELILQLRDTPAHLLLRCELTRLDQFGPTADDRSFGVAVQRLTYHSETD
jgi:2-polyprenyl-3-methyl-5-hydroxy-6-metoxy-1,4-benzoquinol methylase